MLKLVLGRSKSGKTEYVRNYLSVLANGGENKLLMVVPDQQTFDAEKAFLEILGPKVAMNVKVLGFGRICDTVFELTGYVRNRIADDSVKTLLMSIALEDTSDYMKLYSEKALSPQLISMMLDIRRELKKNKITSDIISGVNLFAENEMLSKKLHDISLTFAAYDALLENSFEDPEGELSVAYNLLLSNPVFKDYIICVDSFLGFSEPEYDILSVLMKHSKEFLLTLSDDIREEDDSIFDASRKTAARLTAIAKEQNVSVSSPVICDYTGFYSSYSLSFTEENIYRKSTDKSLYSSDDTLHSVTVYGAKNIYDEADFIAANIKRLVTDENYRYNDIAVISRNIASYGGVIDSALSRYGISYFMDTPGYIHSKPLTKLISACFDCINSYFHKDAVLSVLKSGLTLANAIDVSLFENYVFTWNISGSKFFDEFTANPRGFANEFTSNDLLELTKIERTREFIIPALCEFRDKIKDSTVCDICRALYMLLLLLGVDKKIIELADTLEAQGEYQLSEEQVRLWQVFTETLDRSVKVIGSRTVSPKRFSELLSLQFSAQDMSFIPHGADQVTVGDIDRLRLNGKKIVFVIGAVEGEFPCTRFSNGLFTGSEREKLTQAGLLSDTSARTQALTEEYLCYYALTGASDKLFVSYPTADLKCTVICPSSLISELKSVLGNVNEICFSTVPILDRLWGAEPSFGVYASRVDSTDTVTTALSDYYEKNEKFLHSHRALIRAINRTDFAISNTENAINLFGKNMNLSASQVEKYHLCRFMYFCTYGLRLRERKTAQIDAMEYGSFVHYILEMFLNKYTKLSLVNLSDNDISNDIEQFMDDYARCHFGGIEDKSERFIYLYSRVALYVHKLIKHIIDELCQSSFTPEAFELDIGKDFPAYKLELPTGQTITIRGKVDRADIMRKNDRTYIRIIDYKTGTKVFDLSDIIYGLNLQMLIYLSALTKNNSSLSSTPLVPAGVLYMPSIVPVINAAFDDSSDKILAERNKKLKMNGLILRDMDVIEGMERDCGGVYIPVSAKGESVKGTDNLASLEVFGAIFSHIDRLISDMATELSRGSIEAVPVQGGYDACEYCPYKSVCGHKDTDKSRNVFKLDRKEVLQALGIKEEVGE